MVVADFGQGALFNIRGLGKDLTNVQTPSGVVTYWDGVASFPGFFARRALLRHLEHRGAARAAGHLRRPERRRRRGVRHHQRSAVLGRWTGDGEVQSGSYSDVRLQGFVNMPIGDDAAVRIAFNGEKRDTFYKVSGPYTTPSGRQPGSLLAGDLRVGFLWQPTAQLRIDLKDSLDYVDDGGYLGRHRARTRPTRRGSTRPTPSTSWRSATTTAPTRATG